MDIYLSILITLIIIYISSKIVYNIFFHPLAHIPGPILPLIIGRFPYMAISAKSGQHHRLISDLHKKYGLTIRFGPNVIHFAQPDAMKYIYAQATIPKSHVYDLFVFPGEAQNMLSTPDKKQHAYLRRLMSPGFGISYLHKLTPLTESVLDSLFLKIDSQLEKGADKIDIWNVCQAFAFDIIGTTAFGASFNMIENGSHRVVEGLGISLKFLVQKAIFHEFLLPFLGIYKIAKESRAEVNEFVEDIIQKRIEKKSDRVDLLQLMMNNKDTERNGEGLSNREIVAHARLFLLAGSETSSNSMGHFFLRLIREPKYYKLLLNELDAIKVLDGGFYLKYDQVKDLEYFDAFLKESMRMDPAVSVSMLRLAEKEHSIEGICIPAGTMVTNSMYFVHNAHPGWGDPENFRPERFMETDSKTAEQNAFDRKACDDLYMPFSIGARNCIGKNFAIMEMKIMISNFLTRYTVTDIPEQSLMQEMFVTLQLKSGTYNVGIKKR